MPVSTLTTGTGRVIRVEGEFSVGMAKELRDLLLEAPCEIDLSEATEIDISLLQLLWSAGAEQRRVSAVSPDANKAACEAGFAAFPGLDESGAARG